MKNFNVRLRSIPKTLSASDIINNLKTKTDLSILPILKFATSDIIVQKVTDDTSSKILFASEFMTHTPQHDHLFQRYERIYDAARQRIPMSFIVIQSKTKLEKGQRDEYKKVNYKPTSMFMHLILKTSYINNSAVSVFFWPTIDGYEIKDLLHPTAPKVQDDIELWINWANSLISGNTRQFKKITNARESFLLNNYKMLDDSKFNKLSYDEFIENRKIYYPNFVRGEIKDTLKIISQFNLDKHKLSPSFLKRTESFIFSYKSKEFRTDPYCGFLCGIDNLFVRDRNNNKKLNLILHPINIEYKLFICHPLL